jgi:hypothetical protein
VARNGSTYQYVISLRENFDDLQTFHLNTVGTHTARHAHAFEYTRRVRRTTDRTWSPLTIVLAVRRFAHTVEAVTLYHTLEAFAFCGTDYLNLFALSENVNSDGVANIFFKRRVAEFFYEFLSRSAGFREVTFFCCGGVFFFLFAKSYLERIVAVCVLCFYLRYNARDQLR